MANFYDNHGNLQDVTWWLEATAPSTSIRDIVIYYRYQPPGAPNWDGTTIDSATATAVWVTKNNAWFTRFGGVDASKNPKPGVGGDLPDLVNESVIGFINQSIALDTSRYGYGAFERNLAGTLDTRYGGRILFEFKVAPANVDTKLGVVLDVTRQRQFNDYTLENGSSTFSVTADRFPWLQSPVKDNELPNDDTGDKDEQNIPSSNGMLYSLDSPSVVARARAGGKDLAFAIIRDTFKEWVRMRIAGAFGNQNGGHTEQVEGTRVSDKYDWHVVSYLKRGANGRFIEDNATASTTFNTPVMKGTGNGTAAVTLLTNASTSGYTATYALVNPGQANQTGTWTLTDTSEGTVSVAKLGAIPAGTTWTLTIPNEITLVMTQGTTAFADGDSSVFSSFKTGTPLGRVNEIALGSYAAVTGDMSDLA